MCLISTTRNSPATLILAVALNSRADYTMKKALALIISTLLLLLLIAIAGLYWAMQNQYAAQIINRLFVQFSDTPVSVQSAKYTYPNLLSLQTVEIKEIQENPIVIEKVELRLNLSTLLSPHVTIDSLLISGLRLQSGLPDFSISNRVILKQLAISNLDYSDNSFIIRDANVQINNPQLILEQQVIPFGNIQFSAEQIYWQGEAVDNVLLDADYKKQNSTIYGLSFKWRKGEFSGQAEQYSQGWSLVNATVDKLRLSTEELQQAKQLDLNQLLSNITHINSLDILDSTIALTDFQLTNANLSVENLKLPFNPWTQSQGYLSVSAESIGYLNQLWLDPVFELYLEPNKLQLEDATVELHGGLIQVKGLFTPSAINLSHLNISGLKWISEQDSTFTALKPFLGQINNLKIKDLSVQHSQLIQLASQPNWQISGLSIEGKNTELVRDGKLALWSGKLGVNATNASFDELYSNHPVLNMSSVEGIWKLNDLFIPLNNGLIEATGAYQFNQISKPWQLKTTVYGLPTRLFEAWNTLPIQFEATADFQLEASGLAADSLSLNHSLSGRFIGTLRDSVFISKKSDSEVISNPIEISELEFNADRGRIEIKPIKLRGPDISGLFTGQYDLVSNEKNRIQLRVNEKCKNTDYNLLNKKTIITNTCK